MAKPPADPTEAPTEARDALANHNAPPLNPLPGLVWVLVLAIAAVEAVLWLGGQGVIGGPQAVGWRLEALSRFGFSSGLQVWMLENARALPGHLLRYPAYGFVHAAPMHAFLVIVLIAALGKYVAETLGNRVLLVLIVVPPLLGAMVFGLLLGEHELGWLFGGMPLVFGLVGGLTAARWQRASDRAGRVQAFSIIGLLLAARLGFGLVIEQGFGWIAELAAFAIGFGLTFLISPGGGTRLVQRLRLR